MTVKTIFRILAIIAVVAIAFALGNKTGKRGQTEGTKVERDTLYVRDTILVTKAISVTKRVVDSIYVPADTIRMRDTLFVYLEREQVRWEDSLAIVYASGIHPKVDSVIHFRTERIVTEKITPRVKRFGLGVQAGYGFSKDGMTPYIGIGLSYNLLVF